uniref:RRM domain-containing protein n=1 Tax=Romanomermis culicivorax TaxID=13658 RepID=A0A915KCQ7_ROMCU
MLKFTLKAKIHRSRAKKEREGKKEIQIKHKNSGDMSSGENLIGVMKTRRVDNIPSRMDHGDLRDIFSRYGDVGDVHIPKDFRTGESRGL